MGVAVACGAGFGYASAVFIKRNRSKQGDKTYTSTLLVHGERVPVPRGPGRPKKGEVRKTKVVHRTLANLSKLPEPLVELIDRYCKAERAGEPLDAFVSSGEPVIGPAYGQLAVLLTIARDLGVVRALGDSRLGRLALFLVLARIAHQGSRLSAVRWAETQAVDPLLDLGRFDEDDLYAALDWLDENQDAIEDALAPVPTGDVVFLYDVTSTYVEGQHHELAAPGYNRDGKRYKKIIVAGLLTDAAGEPISIQLYKGGTADPQTVNDQVNKLVQRFGVKEAVFVGDRGMVKAKGRDFLQEHGLRYVTSLTKPEIRKLLKEGQLQFDLFDEELVEVPGDAGKRYILRRNPATTDRARSRRADQLAKVRRKVAERNAKVAESPRCDPDVSLRKAVEWLKTYKLHRFVSARLDGRLVVLEIDESAKGEVELLDGCYVVVSDVPAEAASAEVLWERYGDLQLVERDFRTLKTDFLELRPIFHRKASRTRGLAIVAMLALKIVRELRRHVAPLGLTAEDALDRLQAVRLVTLADPALGLWRLPTRWPLVVQELLDVLPALTAPRLSLGSPSTAG